MKVICLMGFVYYQEQKCDKVVLEVGIGGTLDTTNIITNPIATVVTSIGLDHAEILGNTLESIAENKAGIMKKGTPMIIGSNCQPEEVFKRKSVEIRAPLHTLKQSQSKSFEVYNNNLVSKVFDVLETRGLKLSPQAKNQAFNQSEQCRKQFISEDKLPPKNRQQNNKVVLDVGHNPPALLKLFQTLQQTHPQSNFIVVYGTSKYKNSTQSITNILKYSNEVYLIQADHFRSMDIEILKQKCKEYDQCKIVNDGNIEATITHALSQSKQNDIVVICGSFFIMKQAKGYFYPKEIQECSDPDTRPILSK